MLKFNARQKEKRKLTDFGEWSRRSKRMPPKHSHYSSGQGGGQKRKNHSVGHQHRTQYLVEIPSVKTKIIGLSIAKWL